MIAVNETEERTRLVPYGPLTLGLIQPEWLFTYHYFPEEPDEEEHPPEESGKEKAGIRIHFRARRDPAP
ncbi:MAG: hypothetical protein CW342_08535 [Thermoactinomycetaceae bacterium]|jgi:hypothetical protein|nr:hypothetical protein [Bacillota bacterium]MBO2532921.1 hypothetical protein [Thermoactinomycetaceae bacterium]